MTYARAGKFCADLGVHSSELVVTLDGKPLDDAIEADDQAGVVRVPKRDRKGNVVTSPTGIATVTRTGRVAIRLKRRTADELPA